MHHPAKRVRLLDIAFVDQDDDAIEGAANLHCLEVAGEVICTVWLIVTIYEAIPASHYFGLRETETEQIDNGAEAFVCCVNRLKVHLSSMVPHHCNYVQYRPMRPLNILKLSDEFGQYVIFLKCACGQMRRCSPHTLAAFAGWDAELRDVVRRLRCSKCNQRKCSARCLPVTVPRGYKSH